MRSVRTLHKIAARLPIRWRLALTSFGMLALLLAALGVLISFTEEQTLLTNQAIALHNEAQLAMGTLQGSGITLAPFPSQPPPLPIGSLPPLMPDLHVLGTNLVEHLAGANIRATVISLDGKVIASSKGPIMPPSVTLNRASIRQVLTTPQSTDTYMLAIDSQGQRQLVVLLPLREGSDVVALLQLSTPTALIDRSLTTMRLILILGIIGALGIAAALTLPLVGAALRPLVAMEQTSARIADGALSLRLEVPPASDEIGRLARSFNSMVARLEAAFAQQQQFVADASHELRTPLTVLSGSLEMLLLGADKGDREASRRLLRTIAAEVGRMQRLVEDLLTLTVLDGGRTRLREEVINVGTLVSEVCEQAQGLACGQEIQCTIASALPEIRADADRLRQVLLIIVDNALKFTPTSGRVELIASSESEGEVVIEVRDTGVGIPAEALPHVFDRFYRADPARVRFPLQRGGSGLGLAIAKELIEMHRGKITISSTPGVGTTVTIMLPQ